MDAAWPTLEKLDSPESTIESDDELCDVARLIGRENRVEGLLAAARWCIRNPDAATTPKGLSDAPNVTPRMAQIASLAGPSTHRLLWWRARGAYGWRSESSACQFSRITAPAARGA